MELLFTIALFFLTSNTVNASSTQPVEPLTVEEKIAQYDWDYNIALAVATAESQLNKDAFNPEWHNGCQGSIGVYQIACLHVENPQDLYNEDFNINKAYDIYSKEGWRPWGVCRSGKVKCW